VRRAEPRGVVKWTGVRFGDFADMLGLIPCALLPLIASDRNTSTRMSRR